MKTQSIHSKNAAFQKFEVLQANRNKRHKYGEFLVEGVRNINEAVRNGWEIVSFLYSGEKRLSGWAQELLGSVPARVHYELADSLMRELSGKEDTSELMAVVRMKDEIRGMNFSANPVIALFDRPSNKGNLGTVLRSCDALGVEGLIITGHAVDVYDPGVVSSSMGSFFSVPFYRLPDNAAIGTALGGLRERYPRLQIIGTTAHQQAPISSADLKTPLLFMLGNETDGLNQHLTGLCDLMVTIPMSKASSASSFNVGCAATVMFYEAMRQRGLEQD
jgi:TrmH family RNA methyltransferase